IRDRNVTGVQTCALPILSIRADPSFGSELGVADTLAVMGHEQEARDEYRRAAALVANETERVEYEVQSAATWIREDNHKQACKEIGRASCRERVEIGGGG